MEVFMTAQAWLKMRIFADETPTEVGGAGYAKMLPSGDILVDDLFLLPQEVSSAEVDFEVTNGDEFWVNKAITDGRTGGDNVAVSWHSHGKLGTCWSSTDEDRIQGLKEYGIFHLLSIETNHKGDLLCRLDVFDVEHHGVRIAHVKMSGLEISLDPQEPIFEQCLIELETHVREAPKTTTWKSQPVAGQNAPRQLPQQSASRPSSSPNPSPAPANRPAGTKTEEQRGWLTESEQADSAFTIDPDDAETEALLAHYGFGIEHVFVED